MVGCYSSNIQMKFWNFRNFKNIHSMMIHTFPSGSYDSCPLIVIIGATGCGKTKLSIELAKHYNAEIISADSMQIYKGLDIATNKATIIERQQAPHHLIDQIDPFQQFTVLNFQKLALQSINSILSKGRFPIIVGGTNYYIESILWDTLVGSKLQKSDSTNLNYLSQLEEEFRIFENYDSQIKNSDQNQTSFLIETVEDLMKQKITYRSLSFIPNEKLYRFLFEVDPKSAQSLHVHNRRKVIRCLQVFQQTGGRQRMSDILEEQHSSKGSSRHGGPLRFPNSIILWVDCEKTVLYKRLDDRVDEMIHHGLLEELLKFHRQYNEKRLKQQNTTENYTEGIFQAIGLKEFHQYLLMNEKERQTYEGQLKLGHGILMLKQRTRGYVNKQLKWIRRRFLVRQNVRTVPNVYRLDTTDPQKWNEEVRDKSIWIVDNFLKAVETVDGNPIKESQQLRIWTEVLNPLAVKVKKTDKDDDDSFISGHFYCDICNVSISGGKSYREHLGSKRHQYQIKMNSKKPETFIIQKS